MSKPSLETALYIATNDREFAEQVAANNRACKEAPACRK